MGDGIGDFAFWIMVAVGTGGFWFAVAPVLKAFARRIEGGGGAAHAAALEARIDALEHAALTSGEVDNQFVRLGELEERVDFAERLLTQRRVDTAIGEGTS